MHSEPAGGDHQADQRTSGVPLLRRMRAWMHRTASNYSSAQVQVFPAMKTGRVTLITNAMARELITDDEGKVTAVSYIDKTTRTEKQVEVPDGGAGGELLRIDAAAAELERSAARERPREFVGHGGPVSHRQHRVRTGRAIPALHGMPRHDSDGMGGAHLYMPWWLWDKKTAISRAAITSKSAAATGCRASAASPASRIVEEGYGESLKKAIYEDYGTHVSFAGRGEMIPNEDTYCEIDPNVVDKFGIPVLKFHFKWTDAELQPSGAHGKDVHGPDRDHGRDM